LLENLDPSKLPETSVPIGQGWKEKVKQDDEMHEKKELEEKGE
jgi:hypothetical protein